MQINPQIVVSLVIFGLVMTTIGVGIGRRISQPEEKTVKGAMTQIEASPSAVPEPTKRIPSTPTPSPKPTQTPTVPVLQEPLSTAVFLYPNSQILEKSESGAKMETRDASGTVTDWYKNKLKDLGYNVNSFVTTKANDKVLNKLVSDNGKIQIRIEISQESENSPVIIAVSLTSS